MNNEYNQIIDEAYVNYQWKQLKSFPAEPDSNLSKEEFTLRCKIDTEFTEKWGLKIEERELSFDERLNLYGKTDINGTLTSVSTILTKMNELNIPTELITITYNNETIEIYE